MVQGLTSVHVKKLSALAQVDIDTLVAKSIYYGDSWKSRGGVGAFMMAARKWDRLEHMCEEVFWDIFNAQDTDAILEEIGDLRRYLLLIEDEIRIRLDANETYEHYGTGKEDIEHISPSQTDKT